ncbi:YceI family protein [soil metagenome]
MSTWKIDPNHTDILFSAKHMMVTTVRGKFHEVEGEIELDDDDPTRSRGEVRVGAASLSTGVEQRDGHLRSGDFLDAENHPWITVRVSSIEKQGDGYQVHTELTIRGVTKGVTFEAEFLGFYPSMQGARRTGFHMESRLKRQDWGLNWNVALEKGGWLVSEEVRLEIDIAADEATPSSEASGAEAAEVGASSS